MARNNFPKSRFLSGLESALKSSGKSSLAVSEITRTVAQGMPRSRQRAWIAADSISTASAPVSARKFFFSATVVAMRSVQKIFAGFAPEASNFSRRDEFHESQTEKEIGDLIGDSWNSSLRSEIS